MIVSVTFGAKYFRKFHMNGTPFKGAFAVGTTDKICGWSLSSKMPVDMNSIILKLYVT
jgi:hypothetical protein